MPELRARVRLSQPDVGQAVTGVADNPGWAAWRPNFDVALSNAFATLLWLGRCNGTAEHDGCRGEDCDTGLDQLGCSTDAFAPSAAREVEQDLHGFVTSCLAERPDCFTDMTADQVGYDFILTRNGHGAGFWDRGLGEVGDWLSAMAKPFGTQDAYVSDGVVYVHG